MNKTSRNIERVKRSRRTRVSGTPERPRLCVFRSLHGMSIQAIDDVHGKTVAAASWHDLAAKKVHNTIKEAHEVGKLIGEKCLKLKIETTVFDRSGYQYHGKVKAIAEGVREAGLKF